MLATGYNKEEQLPIILDLLFGERFANNSFLTFSCLLHIFTFMSFLFYLFYLLTWSNWLNWKEHNFNDLFCYYFLQFLLLNFVIVCIPTVKQKAPCKLQIVYSKWQNSSGNPKKHEKLTYTTELDFRFSFLYVYSYLIKNSETPIPAESRNLTCQHLFYIVQFDC